MATAGTDPDVITMVFDPGMTVGEMTIHISPALGAQLREVMSEEGIDYGEVIELSQPTEILDALAPYLTGGGFVLLQAVLVQLIRRNVGKKFKLKVRDHEVEIDGYSASEVKDFVDTLEAKSIENAKAWDEMKEGRHRKSVQGDHADETSAE